MHVQKPWRRGRWAASLLGVALALHAAPVCHAADSTQDEAILQGFETELEGHAVGYPDPAENFNRKTMRLNDGLNRVIFEPLTRAYTFVVPEPGRIAIRRMLANLAAPSTLVNDLLQGHPKDAAVTFSRIAINSTVGFAGLVDAAGCMGLPPHTSDFGQTLAVFGTGSGPYLILPIFGPSTVRDAFGDAVNLLFRPSTYFLAGTESLFYTTAYSTSTGLITLEEHALALRRLESGSLDYYAALRNAYYQNRTAHIAAADDPRPLFPEDSRCHCPGGCPGKRKEAVATDTAEPAVAGKADTQIEPANGDAAAEDTNGRVAP